MPNEIFLSTSLITLVGALILLGTVNLLRPERLSGGGRSKLLRQP